ncbi:MAG: cyclase family protein [Clostridia bacterium]|nr:cyclase family protein [Clostridia bacterium]
MKIYDISQEVFSCAVFSGDPSPKKEQVLSIEKGDICNLTSFSMCAHNGTHIDAPCHFILDGDSVEKIPLEKVVGYAYVSEHNGDLNGEDARAILERARQSHPLAWKKILIKGDATITQDGALEFASAEVDLVGNESQTVGPADSPVQVHNTLLKKGIVLLEGIRLSEVEEGAYFLSSAPLSLSGSDGSPVRAILIEQ